MTGTEVSQAGVGTAHLSPATGNDSGYKIHGVALGANDITVGKSGIKKKWPADELRDAASTLEGKPLVRDHENNTEGTVGKVVSSSYREGVGVVYEGEVAEHYEDLINDIEAGLMEVSVRARHLPVDELEEDEESGALITEKVQFENLSIVSNGASESNSLQTGEAAIMAQGPGGSAVAVLEQGSERPGSEDIMSGFEDEDEEELGFYPIRFYGPVLPNEFVDDNEVESIIEELESHDAITATSSSDDTNILIVVDSGAVDDNEELNDHVISTLEDTPYSVWEDWNWIDDSRTELSSSFDKGSEAIEHCVDNGIGERQVLNTSDELAEINGLDINGMVMWDNQMGFISGFESEDLGRMVEVDVVEKEDGRFHKTGDTVTKPLIEMESEMSESEEKDTDTEELDQDTEPETEELEAAWHTPDWDGLDDSREWEKPSMEDFETDDLGEISDHFFVSKTGEWPPENYGDLALPAVWPNGDLSLDGLDSVHQMAKQTDGVSDDVAESVQNKADDLAQEHFDESVSGEEMSATPDTGEENETPTFEVASLTGDDPDEDQASTDSIAAYTISN